MNSTYTLQCCSIERRRETVDRVTQQQQQQQYEQPENCNETWIEEGIEEAGIILVHPFQKSRVDMLKENNSNYQNKVNIDSFRNNSELQLENVASSGSQIADMSDPDPATTKQGLRDRNRIADICVGSRVSARFEGGEEFFPGTVSAKHTDGSCDICYDDGDIELHVRREFIQKLDDDYEGNKRDGNEGSLEEVVLSGRAQGFFGVDHPRAEGRPLRNSLQSASSDDDEDEVDDQSEAGQGYEDSFEDDALSLVEGSSDSSGSDDSDGSYTDDSSTSSDDNPNALDLLLSDCEDSLPSISYIKSLLPSHYNTNRDSRANNRDHTHTPNKDNIVTNNNNSNKNNNRNQKDEMYKNTIFLQLRRYVNTINSKEDDDNAIDRPQEIGTPILALPSVGSTVTGQILINQRVEVYTDVIRGYYCLRKQKGYILQDLYSIDLYWMELEMIDERDSLLQYKTAQEKEGLIGSTTPTTGDSSYQTSVMEKSASLGSSLEEESISTLSSSSTAVKHYNKVCPISYNISITITIFNCNIMYYYFLRSRLLVW